MGSRSTSARKRNVILAILLTLTVLVIPVSMLRSQVDVPGVVEPTVFYLHHDPFGQLLARTDEDGAVVWTSSPAPFGVESSSTETHKARFLSNVKMDTLAPEGGAYQLGARTYLPYLGRFTTPDPLPVNQVAARNPQNFNRYGYALNNPYRYVDATGLYSEAAVSTFQQIIRAARGSALMRYVIGRNSSGVEHFFPNGTARNIAFNVTFQENGSFFFCNGISEVAEAVIGQAIAEGKLPQVASYGTIERKNEGEYDRQWNFLQPDHTAVYVRLTTGEEYVLDWHATLNVFIPKITHPTTFCLFYDVCDVSDKSASQANAKTAEQNLAEREKIIRSSEKGYTGQ